MQCLFFPSRFSILFSRHSCKLSLYHYLICFVLFISDLCTFLVKPPFSFERPLLSHLFMRCFVYNFFTTSPVTTIYLLLIQFCKKCLYTLLIFRLNLWFLQTTYIVSQKICGAPRVFCYVNLSSYSSYYQIVIRVCACVAPHIHQFVLCLASIRI
jgi:hypothetical protein